MSSSMIYRLKNDASVISSVARTISLAFTDDPLIRWLRPNAAPWSTLSHEICKWQQRRIQTAILDGYVFYRASEERSNNASSERSTSKPGISVAEVEKPLLSTRSKDEDIPAAVILFPPSEQLRWSLRRIILACKLWVSELVDAAPDSGTCMRRLDHLLTAHDESLAKIKTQFGIDNLWYLEVLAVHPSLQSRGMGGRTMKWLLEYLDERPVALECTAQSNVAFYERFGFRVVEEVKLTDEQPTTEDGSTVYWVMLRDRQGLATVT